MIKRVLATILLLTIALLALPRVALGFGMTPAEIFIEQIKPGGHFEREVYLTRSTDEVDEDLEVVLETDLGEMESWFKFEPGKEFTFPTGESNTTFRVIIDVPQGVSLDTYKGKIVAKGLSDKKAKEGITIVKGAVLGVNVVASDVDVYDLEVLSIDAPEVNSGDPVRLNLNVKNLGNTAIAPDKVTLDVMDLFEKPIESLSDTTLEKIDAFATKQIQAEFNSNLEKGQYRIDASVTFMGEEIARKKMVLTVNAKPARVGEEYVQTPESTSQTRDIRSILMFVALATFALAMAALVKILRLGKEIDAVSKRGLLKLLHTKKPLVVVILAGVSILAMAFAVYYFLLLRNSVLTHQINQDSVAQTDENDNVVPTDETMKEASPSSEKDVKGVSTEAEESVAPIIINKPSVPTLYLVYEKPDFASEVVYEAENGETFDVIRQSGDWYNIELNGGTNGWLHKTSVKESK